MTVFMVKLVVYGEEMKSSVEPLSPKGERGSTFDDIEREDYLSAIIAIYELQDVWPMVDLFVFLYLRTCAVYDSTIKAIDFDEIRVRYRSQRRAIIREVINQNLIT